MPGASTVKTLIIIFLLAAIVCCQSKDESSVVPAGDPETVLKGFWRSSNGLHYLDLSGQGPISMVLPNRAGTFAPDSTFSVGDKELIIVSGPESFSLKFSSLPPEKGKKRCFEVEDTRLCLTERK